ncbi:unnamed protein product [Macrosiphum euphorbiae]|uniref:DUF659 domain-containing protein n=1 Tax=Macrosiphum euphorbiae TaxID=13131 RepID=A0AAV0XWQ5_9HEMI|nr:unnamed protein product [Macrosiphum euphorbiae]
MKSFLGITIHLYIQSLSMKSGIIGVIELNESHTANYISQEMLKCLNEWDIPIDKLMAVVSDNGANITKVVKDSFVTYKYVPCFAHTINLIYSSIVEKSISNTTSLIDLLSNVREIMKHFKRSTFLSDELRKKQINQGIKDGAPGGIVSFICFKDLSSSLKLFRK